DSAQLLTQSLVLSLPGGALGITLAKFSLAGFPDMSLSPADIQQIKNSGISGTVSVYSANNKYGRGRHSRGILIMQEPVRALFKLKEPDATSIIYIQDVPKWRQFPAHAPNRTIRIEPQWDDPRQNSVMVELLTDATQGFGVWCPKRRWVIESDEDS